MGPGLAPVYVKTLLAAATVIDLAAAVLSVAYDARTFSSAPPQPRSARIIPFDEGLEPAVEIALVNE